MFIGCLGEQEARSYDLQGIEAGFKGVDFSMIKGSALKWGLDTKTSNHLYFVTPYSLHLAGIP